MDAVLHVKVQGQQMFEVPDVDHLTRIMTMNAVTVCTHSRRRDRAEAARSTCCRSAARSSAAGVSTSFS